MQREKTFTVRFNYFEPGTFITPTSRRSPLKFGAVYRVLETQEPLFAGEEAIVAVQGWRTGVSAEYLREATKDEIAALGR